VHPSLERQINILDYAAGSLWRHRLKYLSILLVFSLVIFLVGSFHLVAAGLAKTASRLLATAPDITIQRMVAGRQESIPLAYQEKLSGLFGVKSIAPRIWGYVFDETRGANITVIGVEPERLIALPWREDVPLPAAPADQGRAILGRGVAGLLGVGTGGVFSLFTPDLRLKPFEVAGVLPEAADIIAHDLMVVTLADARELFGLPRGMVTDLMVDVANPAEIPNLADKISKILPDARVLTRNQIEKTYQVVFGWRSGVGSVCLLAALSAFVILAWNQASGLTPEERREITILKIIGWQTSDVLLVRFWEGGLVALFAFLLGVTASLAHVLLFDGILFKPVLLGWSVIRPPLAAPPSVEVKDLLLLASFTILPYLAVTVVPAWRAASRPAEEALGG